MIGETKVTLEVLHDELAGLREFVRVALQPGAQSRPLSALQLMERWAVPGETESMRLDNLAKRCRQWGLRPMLGTRGASATYMLSDVLAAESYASGKTKRRRAA